MPGKPFVRALLLAALFTSGSGCALFRVSPPDYPVVTLESGLVIHDLVIPEEGPIAAEGDRVSIEYTMSVEDGSIVDSTQERAQPFDFEIGAGEVPRGLEDGVTGMRERGRRELRIPPELGYGSEGLPPHVPPDAWIFFDVELITIGQMP